MYTFIVALSTQYTQYSPFYLAEDVNSAEQNVRYLSDESEDVEKVDLVD